METNEQLDKWSSDKCQILESTDDYERPIWFYPEDKHTYEAGEWTLLDARCREIVREHFKIKTFFNCNETYSAQKGVRDSVHDERPIRTGESIEEAEIACIAAIMEAEK